MKLTKRLTLLLGATAIVATACPAPSVNAKLESDAGAIVTAMKGTIEYRGTGTKECPGPTGGSHWGSTYEALVCVSGGLSTADSLRGAVALHEAAHAWFYRMQVWYFIRGLSFPGWGNLSNEENAADCFSQVRGAPSTHSANIKRACTAAELDTVRGWMEYFPVNNSTNWVY